MTGDTAIWIQAASAIVQAAAAAIIVFLTIGLALTARNALRASRDQADAAAAALAEMRREHLELRRQSALASLPMLSVSTPVPEIDVTHGLVSHVQVTNAGSAPALALQLEIRAQDRGGEVGEYVYARHGLSIMVPGTTRNLAVSSQDLLDMKMDWGEAQAAQARGDRPAFYHRECLILDFTFRTPLGAEVRQRYRWYPNEPESADQTLVWRLLRVRILPDPANEQDVIEIGTAT